MKSSRVSIVAARAIAASFALVCNAVAEEPGTPASVIATDQKPKREAVSITYVFIPKEEVLAIYSADPAHTGAKRLGEAALAHGDHRNVSVELSGAPKTGTQLWAVVEPKGGKPSHGPDGTASRASM